MEGQAAEIRDAVVSVAGAAGPRAIADVPRLDIRPGAMTALAGPSGSGKSTLLYLLAGLIVPQQGSVCWNGVDLARLGECARDAWRLRMAGFVFQSFNLIDELPPLDNVLITSGFAGTGARPLRARAGELLDRFEVPRERKRVALLSRGEQQRVAIARALLRDPGIIFADEPTASLDARAGAFVAETLRQLAHGGCTVVVASHDPLLLAAADQTLRLDHGRIVTADTQVAA